MKSKKEKRLETCMPSFKGVEKFFAWIAAVAIEASIGVFLRGLALWMLIPD